MADLNHQDTADDAFHEIQLSGKQLVFLFMATTIVAVAIFLCGVMVGRGVKADRSVEPGDSMASASASPPPSASVPSQTAAQGGPPAAEPPAPADEGADDLSYAKRLQAESTPSEKLKPQGQSTPSASPPPQLATAKPSPAPATSAPSAGRPGVWVVQLVALKDHGAAAAVAQQLVAKGYPAFVVSPAPGAPAIFRVQVGRYNDRREAEQVARRLEKEGQFKPWISH